MVQTIPSQNDITSDVAIGDAIVVAVGNIIAVLAAGRAADLRSIEASNAATLVEFKNFVSKFLDRIRVAGKQISANFSCE
jgi:hypothetical protein